jgi:putative acetyltransferase
LINEHVNTLGLDLSFQDFEHELDNLESEYAPPSGAFFFASEDDQLIGRAGLRRFAGDAAEIKRLYVAPAARGCGIGRRLAQAASTRRENFAMCGCCSTRCRR